MMIDRLRSMNRPAPKFTTKQAFAIVLWTLIAIVMKLLETL